MDRICLNMASIFQSSTQMWIIPNNKLYPCTWLIKNLNIILITICHCQQISLKICKQIPKVFTKSSE